MRRTILFSPTQRAPSDDSSAGRGRRRQAQWAQEEFAHAPLPDRRRVKRLILMASDVAQHPTAPIPPACGCWAKTKAAYRFFDNDTIGPEDLLAAHAHATLVRARAHRVVLRVQDTTTLNYSTPPQTKGLGPIGNNRDKTLGCCCIPPWP